MRSKFLSLIGIIILSVQCSNDNITSKGNSAPENDDSILGEEFEAMDISQSQCKVSSEGGMSVVEVANYDWWFISEVEAQIGDDDAITIYNTKSQNPLKYIEGSWFRLELIDEGKRQLRIIINKNETALARRLYVSISAGVESGEIVVDQQSANIKDLATDVEGVFHYLSSEGGACESRLISNDMWSIIQVEEQIGDGDVQVHNPSEMLSSAIIEGSWYKVEIPKEHGNMLLFDITENSTSQQRKVVVCMKVAGEEYSLEAVQEPAYL